MSTVQLQGSCCYSTLLTDWKICVFRQEIGWRNSQAIGKGNIASASMTRGVSVFAGQRGMPLMWKSWITIKDEHEEVIVMKSKVLAPVHPGEILMEEFLKPLNLSQYKLAKDINVPARRINEIVHGKRSVSADTALRLSRYFNLSERFWLNLQARYDLEVEKDKFKGRMESEVKVFELQSA
jgi:antitoxin HigA-1